MVASDSASSLGVVDLILKRVWVLDCNPADSLVLLAVECNPCDVFLADLFSLYNSYVEAYCFSVFRVTKFFPIVFSYLVPIPVGVNFMRTFDGILGWSANSILYLSRSRLVGWWSVEVCGRTGSIWWLEAWLSVGYALIRGIGGFVPL